MSWFLERSTAAVPNLYIYMALDRSGAYIFGKNCIISPVLKQKWPKKKGQKNAKKKQFLEKGIFGSKWVVKRNKKERIRSTQYVRSHF